MTKTPNGLPRDPYAVIPTIQKLGWGAGSFAANGLNNGVFGLYVLIYNVGLGVPAVWLGWAIAIPRLFDALIDSWIGNLSDNTRTRWGRRRPYIALGTTIGAITFAALWIPPLGWSKPGLFDYFFIITIIFFIGYAFFSITYTALGLELSSDTVERTRLFGCGMIAAQTYGLYSPCIYMACLYLGSWMQAHHHAITTVPAEVIGIRYVGAFTALLIFITGLFPATFCRERQETQSQPQVKFFHALYMTLSNGPFLRLCCIYSFFLLGIYMLLVVGTYISIYYVCQGDKNLTATLGLWSGVGGALYGILVTPFTSRLSARTGKKLLLIAGIAGILACYMTSWIFLIPGRPWLSLVTLPVSLLGNVFVNLMCSAMVADICDLDELSNGLRREGVFSAVFSLFFKGSISIASLLSGYLLLIAGASDGVAPSAHSLLIMRILFVAIPAATLSLSLFLAWSYPISEAMVNDAKLQLEARHGFAATPVPEAAGL
jgi:glycoside/pentoside/hexuronide:cation symporter, GPH family